MIIPKREVRFEPLSKPSRKIKLLPPDNVETQLLIDKTLPSLYSDKSVYADVETPKRVYYRAYKSDTGYAVLYIFTWDNQVFPPHKYDYEPVIVITDKNMNPKYVYVDREHYFVKGYKIPYGETYRLYTDNTWRSMTVKLGTPSDDEVELYPINEKEGILGPAPVYLTGRILAKLENREENPLKINEKIIKNPWSVSVAKHWTTFHEPSVTDIIDDLEKNYGINKKWSTEKIMIQLKQVLHKIIRKLEEIIPRSKSKEKLKKQNRRNNLLTN